MAIAIIRGTSSDFLKITILVYGAVKPSDTPEEEIVAKLAEAGFAETAVRPILQQLASTKSIVEVRPGVWQRWHGAEAQEKLHEDG